MEEENLKKYFQVYSKFLSRDLYISLRPITQIKTSNDIKYYIGGRQGYILYKFLEVFQLTIENKAPQEVIKQSLNLLSKVVDVYLSDNESSEPMATYITFEAEQADNELLKLIYDEKSKAIYTYLFDAMKHLKKHSKRYKAILNDFQKAEDTKVSDKEFKKIQVILVQAIIEFSNAMSHLLFALIENKKDAYNNINKALTHIHRATLDNYKAMIKNLEIGDEKDKLITLRVDEFKSMGIETTHLTKEKIIEDYRSLALNLIVDFPANAAIINQQRKKEK